MLAIQENRLCPCCGTPRRLAHLLDLYERNFRLVQRLLPDLDAALETAVSRSGSDLPLHLRVLERDRYTLCFKLTYEFTDDSGVRRQPDITVRVYRDAAVAEALECTQRPPWLAEEGGDPLAHAYLDAQWHRNLMLGKWLEYLLDHGHGFVLAGRATCDIAA